jgi:CHAT domain-containing protein
VADDELVNIPYAALIDSQGKYLIETHDLTRASSLQRLRATKEEWTWPGREVAVFGNPKLGSRARGDLPGAEAEAVGVCRLTGCTALATGTRSTLPRFLKAAITMQVLHYAGHADIMSDTPQASALLLADAKGGETRLSQGELAMMPDRSTALVVLDACGSATKRVSHFEGSASIAETFVDRGARVVIGALQDVDDRKSGRIVECFYGHILRGVSPAHALRLAQLRELKRGVSPESWALFVVYA